MAGGRFSGASGGSGAWTRFGRGTIAGVRHGRMQEGGRGWGWGRGEGKGKGKGKGKEEVAAGST